MLKLLPKWLQRSESELAAERETQDLRRAGAGRGRLTEAERLVSRGALIEETARGNLAASASDPLSATQHLLQLAHGLALQGRYEEAAQHAPTTPMKRHYGAIAEAIAMDDDEKCGCGDVVGEVVTGGEVRSIALTPRYSAQAVYSRKHGNVVELITCHKCGHLNARPARSRLLQSDLPANRRAAQTDGRGAVSDIQQFAVTPLTNEPTK